MFFFFFFLLTWESETVFVTSIVLDVTPGGVTLLKLITTSEPRMKSN